MTTGDQYAHARTWGVRDAGPRQTWHDRRIETELARIQARQDKVNATRRVICGAKTRKGAPCRMKSEPGKKRCKFHGGKSTGPRTRVGRQRIAEAQRRRWERWHEQQTPEKVGHPVIVLGA